MCDQLARLSIFESLIYIISIKVHDCPVTSTYISVARDQQDAYSCRKDMTLLSFCIGYDWGSASSRSCS